MSTDDKCVNIHIIHSMKGGCGKSACSLFKALELSKENVAIDEVQEAKALFLDADFRGSAWQWLLFEANCMSDAGSVVSPAEEDCRKVKGRGIRHRFHCPADFSIDKTVNTYLGSDDCTLEDILIHSYSYDPDNTDEMLEREDLQPILQINGYVDFLLSSYKSKEKDKYRYSTAENGYQMPSLAAGIYTYRMSRLLRQILNHGKPHKKAGGQYRDIVIDMPPGYDEYSDLLLMELRALSTKDTNIRLHYYCVTTNDVGHMQLAMENIDEILAANSKYRPYDSVNVILNCMHSDDFNFSVAGTEIQADIEKLISLLQKRGARGEVFRNSYMDSYHRFCRSHKAEVFECAPSFMTVSLAGGSLTVK